MHSPDTSVITSAFCIDENKIGQGINQYSVCEAMEVDWNKDIYKSFYGNSNRLIAKGSCSKQNLTKLAKEVRRQSEAMKKIDSKIAIMSDKLEFQKIFESSK